MKKKKMIEEICTTFLEVMFNVTIGLISGLVGFGFYFLIISTAVPDLNKQSVIGTLFLSFVLAGMVGHALEVVMKRGEKNEEEK